MWFEIKGILSLIAMAAIIVWFISEGIDKLLNNKEKKKKWYEQDSKK